MHEKIYAYNKTRQSLANELGRFCCSNQVKVKCPDPSKDMLDANGLSFDGSIHVCLSGSEYQFFSTHLRRTSIYTVLKHYRDYLKASNPHMLEYFKKSKNCDLAQPLRQTNRQDPGSRVRLDAKSISHIRIGDSQHNIDSLFTSLVELIKFISCLGDIIQT